MSASNTSSRRGSEKIHISTRENASKPLPRIENAYPGTSLSGISSYIGVNSLLSGVVISELVSYELSSSRFSLVGGSSFRFSPSDVSGLWSISELSKSRFFGPESSDVLPASSVKLIWLCASLSSPHEIDPIIEAITSTNFKYFITKGY